MNAEAYRAIVFNSARDGNLRRLRIFLEERSDEWLIDCLSAHPKRTPPIVIAARNGHLDVVKYLMEKGANVSVAGTVSFDGELIPGAPALWAAAAAGHLNIVRYLVEEGHADINQTTLSKSSPLRGACYDGHFEIVRYLVEKGANMELGNRYGHTPLMIAAFKLRSDIVNYLLQKGASPCRSTSRGNTALHDAAEAGSCEIVDILMRAGARNVRDDSGVTPLMCAALAGHADVLRMLKRISSEQQIRDAFKLYGATLVDKKMDLTTAVHAWMESLSYGDPLPTRFTSPVYEDMPELDSIDDLYRVMGDPDAIRLQALIIRERVLGGNHHETLYFIRYRGAVYCDLGRVDRCFQLWMHALYLQQRHLCALHPSTISTVSAFIDTFILALNDGIINANNNGLLMSAVSQDHVLDVLNSTVFELERYAAGDEWIKNDDMMDEMDDRSQCVKYLMLASLQLLLLSNRFLPTSEKSTTSLVNSYETSPSECLKRAVERFVKVCATLQIYPLHAACCDIDKPITARFPCASVILMLIHAGVDVNSKDDTGNTPLHTLLLMDNPRQSIVRLLLDNGAEILARNQDGKTCFQLIQEKLPRAVGQLKIGRYLTLVGFAANAVRRYHPKEKCGRMIPLDLAYTLNLC